MRKTTFLIISLLLTSLLTNAQNDMKVIYVYDPLCGWCYGFSPVIKQFAQEKSPEVDFEIISGGMVTGSRIGPASEIAPYISEAYKDVEAATGIEFGEKFLNGTLKEGTAIFTSIPASVALSIIKHHKPESAIDFAADVQKAIYYHGMEPADTSGYAELAAKYGLDKTQFMQDMASEKFNEAAQADFKKSDEYGVRGFPTVLGMKNDTATVLTRGAVDYETLVSKFNEWKK